MKEEKEEEFEEAKELFKEGLFKILRATKKLLKRLLTDSGKDMPKT
jgi:HEPN domain-containing protein